MARAVYSSGPDPRLDYPAGYGWGEALVRLSQLLRQGTDSYQHQQTVDEESKRRDDAYRLQLQKFLTEEQDKQAAVAARGAQRTNTNAFYKALAGQSGANLPDVQDPSSLDPTALKFALEQLVPKAKAPPEPPATVAPGVGVRNPQGGYDVPIPLAEKATPVTAERTAALAASALTKIKRGETPTPEEQSALETYNLKSDTATKVAAATGENAKRAEFEPADAPRPTLPNVGAVPMRDRNPDYREGVAVPVQAGSSVDLAARRDLVPPPAAKAPQTILQRRVEQQHQTEIDVQQANPVGDKATNYVLKSTGLPPPPSMPLGQVLKEGVAVTQPQQTALGAARRGLAILKSLENPEVEKLFPDEPVKGKGLLPALGNAARAEAFKYEAKLRAKSDPAYAQFITDAAIAIPALAKATGEVGNLSQMEQDVVREAIGIARTKQAWKGGLQAYRQALERAFKANGVPIPAELRSGADETAPPTKDATGTGTIRVIRKSDGKPGTMPESNFNPDLYERAP